MGFELIGRMEEVLDSCDELTSPYYLGAFVLADINDEDYYLKINNCLKKDIKGKSFVLRFGAVQAPLTKKEKVMVEGVWRGLKERDAYLALINEDLFKKDFKDKKNLTFFSKTIDALSSWDHLASLAGRMYVYAGLKNFGKVDKLAKDFLEAPEVFNYYKIEWPYKEAALKFEIIAKLLATVRERIGISRLYDAFLLKVYQSSSPSERDALEDEMDLPLSASRIKKVIFSPVFGSGSSLAWAEWARDNLSQKEAARAFENVPVSVLPKNLSVLKFYSPLTQERRDGMARAFGELLKSKDPKKLSLAIEILENDSWKKYLSSKEGVKTPPIFKLKRKVFDDNIENNRAILFSVYQLFKLGDFRREHFIKLLALRSYGLPATFLLPIQ